MSSNLNLLLRPSHKSQIVRTNMKPNIHPFAQKWQIPPLAQQQKDFEKQLKEHVANTTSSNIAADSLPLQQPAFIPWAVQIEKQQQKLEKYPMPNLLQSINLQNQIPPQLTTIADQINSIPPKSLPNKASDKIPSVFVPQIASIKRLTAIIDNDPNPITYLYNNC